MKKRCTHCKKIKDISEFNLDNSRPDKKTIRCKYCCKESSLKWRRSTLGKKWTKDNRKRINKTNKKYIQTEKGKLCRIRNIKKYPEKYKARNTLNSNLACGKIKRLPCKICGNPKSEGHHDDYSKPLEVTWYCRKHHREVHKKLRKKELLAKKKKI